MRAPEVVLVQDMNMKPAHAVDIVLRLRLEGWIFVSKPVVVEEDETILHGVAPARLIRMDGYVDAQAVTSRQLVPPSEIESSPSNLLDLVKENVGKHYSLAVGKILELF